MTDWSLGPLPYPSRSSLRVTMTRITPFLWFDDQAEEAVDFYLSVFDRARTLRTVHYADNARGPTGAVMTIEFELDGQHFTALNGGPHFSFSPAISFVVKCRSQDEVDRYWDRLLDGGEASQCGWLTDRFGVSWQIVPIQLFDMLTDPDTEAVQRTTDALLQMVKLDLSELRAAFAGP